MAKESVKPPFVRSAYNYDTMEASDASGLLCLDDSLAVQDSREECDINEIVRRFGLTGRLPEDFRLPEYGDFTGVTDFQTAMNAVNLAREEFMKVPADIRARFHNDPGRFVEFCSKEDNRDELKRLGLLKEPPPPVVPIKVEVTNSGVPPETGLKVPPA